jgi:hypothetical protein
MVMRDDGRRPKSRHPTRETAEQEAQRIAASNPGSAVWLIHAQVVATFGSREPGTGQDVSMLAPDWRELEPRG